MKFLDYFLHLDDKLADMCAAYGPWVYGILFLIIFVETGLVLWPFLPGDSLLFIAGSFAANPKYDLSLGLIIVLLFIAAVLGDNTNYFVGKFLGHRVVKLKFRGKPLVKQEWLDKTHAFYEKHGSRTVILARFIPIVRTIAPFVAGVGTMQYRKFIVYDVIGGFIWIAGFSTLGYLLGNITFVKENITLLAIGIVFVSVSPVLFGIAKNYLGKKKA